MQCWGEVREEVRVETGKTRETLGPCTATRHANLIWGLKWDSMEVGNQSASIISLCHLDPKESSGVDKGSQCSASRLGNKKVL